MGHDLGSMNMLLMSCVYIIIEFSCRQDRFCVLCIAFYDTKMISTRES